MSSARSGDLPVSFEEIAVALARVLTDIDFALDVDDHQAFEDACRERGVLLNLRDDMLRSP